MGVDSWIDNCWISLSRIHNWFRLDFDIILQKVVVALSLSHLALLFLKPEIRLREMRLLHSHSVIERLLHFLFNNGQHVQDGGFELCKLIPADAWIGEIRDECGQYFVAENVAGK